MKILFFCRRSSQVAPMKKVSYINIVTLTPGYADIKAQPAWFHIIFAAQQVLNPRRFTWLLLPNKCSARDVFHNFCCTICTLPLPRRKLFFILPCAGLNEVPGMLIPHPMMTLLDSDVVIVSRKNWWSIKKLESQWQEYSFWSRAPHIIWFWISIEHYKT